jgi:hypothetical protein
MQFTPQQLAGGASFSDSTRIGNWVEDVCLRDYQRAHFEVDTPNNLQSGCDQLIVVFMLIHRIKKIVALLSFNVVGRSFKLAMVPFCSKAALIQYYASEMSSLLTIFPDFVLRATFGMKFCLGREFFVFQLWDVGAAPLDQNPPQGLRFRLSQQMGQRNFHQKTQRL